MKRRFVSILMALVMALSLLPAQALAEDTNVTKLTSTSGDLGSGVYQLDADVTITSTLNITGDTTVDLNGHVLRFDQSAQPDSIFRVEAGKTLTLTDSRPAATHEDAKLPAGGLITGGKGYRHDGGHGGYHIYYYYGGGVYVETGASFELAGAPSMPAASGTERFPRMAAASTAWTAPSPCPAASSAAARPIPAAVS